MSGLMQRYNESLEQTPGPVLPKDLPRITVDYRGLLAYARQKGVDPAALSEDEKNRFVTRKPDQEQTA